MDKATIDDGMGYSDEEKSGKAHRRQVGVLVYIQCDEARRGPFVRGSMMLGHVETLIYPFTQRYTSRYSR